MNERNRFSGTDLELDGGWRIGEDAFEVVLEKLRGAIARSIVEFGSGASSIRLALALPDAQVFAVDHDPEWAAKTVALARAYGVHDRVRVETRPLRWQWLAGAPYLTYRAGPLAVRVDALIIDGPPASTIRGREGCLHLASAALRPGALIILDDFSRQDEHVAVENWRRSFPGALEGVSLDVGHGLWLGTVTGELTPHFAPARTIDLWISAARRVRLRVREVLASRGK